MTVLTIGGATQDIFLSYEEEERSSLCKREFFRTMYEDFLLFGAGEKIEIAELFYQSGGGATNTAASFKKLGFTTRCCASIGDDYFGSAILKELADREIDTKLIQQRKENKTGVSCIIQEKNKEQVVCAFRGANCFLKADQIPNDAIKESKYLYITSLSNEAAQELTKLTQVAKECNVPIALNPGKSQLTSGALFLKNALSMIDIIIMNKTEAELFMKTLMNQDQELKDSLRCENNMQQCSPLIDQRLPYLLEDTITLDDHEFSLKLFFQKLLDWGPRIIVVTHGCNGVYVATKSRCYFHPSKPVTLVSSVGAGDAFGSAFVGALLKKYPIERAIRFGILNSASVLSSLGAKTGLLSFDELEKEETKLPLGLLKEFSLR